MLIGNFLGFILVIVGASLVFLLVLQTRKAKLLEKAEKLAKMEQEAVAFFEQLYRTGFKPVETRLILQKEEFALLEQTCVALQETRSFRVYGGGGTRVGKIYLGGGVSESEQRWKQIDVGTLTLTTKRIVFDGSREPAEGKPTPSAAPPQEVNSGTAQLTAPLHQRAISSERSTRVLFRGRRDPLRCGVNN